MRIERASGALWLDAMRRRWSLRRVAGESRWQLLLRTVHWLRLGARQTDWLRAVEAHEPLRQAALVDPRLYERWHRPCISTGFDVETRQRAIASHYAFLSHCFPPRLYERIVLGGGARIASLRLDDASLVHLHLRKPSRADAGELVLLLLTDDKAVLASCALTFDRADSVTIGSLRGAGRHTPFEATREFMQGSHGLHPGDLLMALVREMAALFGLDRVRAVSAGAACVARLPGGVDAFWREHGGMPTEHGCHELPLVMAPVVFAEGPRSRHERRLWRDAFLREACATFARAFRGRPLPGSVVADVACEVPPARGRGGVPVRAAADRGGLLAAGL